MLSLRFLIQCLKILRWNILISGGAVISEFLHKPRVMGGKNTTNASNASNEEGSVTIPLSADVITAIATNRSQCVEHFECLH